MTLNILFLGDIMGRPGRKAVEKYLPELQKKYAVDFTIANAENIAHGRGMNHSTLKEMYACGVDAITLGNHMFDQAEWESVMEMDRKVMRPENFVKVGGKGYRFFEVKGKKICVMNMQGAVFMPQKVNCPFETSRAFHKEYRMGADYDALVLDFHAEATAEKLCIGHIWDGRASLVVGTHTHVPTADARIMPKGTAYQTDAGMCGDYESSLGCTFESAVSRFEHSKGGRLEIAGGEGTLCGVFVRVNEKGLAEHVESIRLGGVLEHQNGL